jgi:hypothetical protein
MQSKEPTARVSRVRFAVVSNMQDEQRLLTAAGYIAEEWRGIAQTAARLAHVHGARSSVQSADLDAGLLHYRCVVNFCCGNFKGRWDSADIKPADFLGRKWWPVDEELDRRLRGRLPGINRALGHLSWDRLDLSIMWPFALLAYEADYVLRLFLAEAESDELWTESLRVAAAYAAATLPPREAWGSSVVEPAPPRGGPV